jgi:hypothetical protein
MPLKLAEDQFWAVRRSDQRGNDGLRNMERVGSVRFPASSGKKAEII